MASLLPIITNDSFSLRVAVIEACQFACPYCLPGSIKPITKKYTWLDKAEYLRLANALSYLPISKIRFTGGEPLLRKDLCDVISAFRSHFPNADLSITTNGQHLERQLPRLLSAHISRINVHIDSLSQQKYLKIMGNGDVNKLLSFLLIAKSLIDEIKINVVLQRGVNDDELPQFIEYSLKTGIEVRFIELMNTGSAKNYVDDAFLAGADAIQILKRSFDISKIGRRHRSDPAELYEISGTKIRFGLIASDTQPFCQDCNRLRLNTEGSLRGCLYQPQGLSLGNMVRQNSSIEDLRQAINSAVFGKRSFHPLINKNSHEFSMSEIGG